MVKTSVTGGETHRLLEGYPVAALIAVQWGDQDLLRHVNNVTYVRWLENARVEYFKHMHETSAIERRGFAFLLVSILCNYKRSVHFPDTVEVGCRTERIGNTSLVMEHVLVSHTQNEVVADGKSVLVAVDTATHAKTPIPRDYIEVIEDVEGRTIA